MYIDMDERIDDKICPVLSLKGRQGPSNSQDIQCVYILAHISKTGFQLFSLVVHMSPL